MNPKRNWMTTIGIVTCVSLLIAGCAENNKSGSSPAPTHTAEASPSQKPATSPTASAGASIAPTPSPTSKPSAAPSPTAPAVINGNVPSEQAKKLISERSAEVIAAIKAKDMKKLATYVHPELGVRFSPYTYVDMKNNLVFKAAQLTNLLTDPTEHNWGEHDGSGDSIKLTFASYYDKYVYNHDFATPEKISYNESIAKGNMINNTRTVYPTSIVVEYYFSGFDKKFEGLDWAGLKLVFENQNNQWYLVGIVHDQWTV
ncbi:MAG: hypothetical protein K0R67_2393 [Paenibacillus sp.]|jgi:hypothetical protein|nr:hypothetical protein [Paenibacillus sp.]